MSVATAGDAVHVEEPDSSPAQSSRTARGFGALVVTQFFGATNDNILKGVLIYMVIHGSWSGQLGSGGQGIVSLCLTLPFLLLSGVAGQVADKHSKRDISVLMKVAEIPIAVLALIGFWSSSLFLTLGALVALSSQSAIFGPAKYGMIPELVPAARLSRANGLINMMTNIAVIVGTLAAGKIADVYSPLPSAESSMAPSLWLPGAVILTVAVAGVISVMFLTSLPAGNPSVMYSRNPFEAYSWSLKKMAETPLLFVALAGGYFYFLAGLALLILPEYTTVLQAYDVSRVEVSVLLGVLGIAIGLGSAVAGIVSGHRIRPGLIPIGALGITVFFFLLGTVPATLPDLKPIWRVLFSSHSGLILGAGFSAGFYIIPLQALLQQLSPRLERGRFLGTANAISFAFLTASALLYSIIRPAFTESESIQHPEKIFLVCAALMAAGIVFLLMQVKARGLSLNPVTTDDSAVTADTDDSRSGDRGTVEFCSVPGPCPDVQRECLTT